MSPHVAALLAWWTFAAVALIVGVGTAISISRGSGVDVFFVVIVFFPAIGALIVSRQPRNAVGWILVAEGLVVAIGGALSMYADYGHTHPGSLPRPDIAQALIEPIWVPVIGLMATFLILLFPDGRLPSPRWKPWARLCASTMVAIYLFIALAPGTFTDSGLPDVRNPLGVEALRPFLDQISLIVLLMPICMVGCAVALVRRFRRARGEERLQMKWLATAGAVAAAIYLAIMVADALLGTEHDSWLQHGVFAFFLIPVAIGVAILKYRLYNIDVIINRALVYGTLTGSLTVVYFLVVTLLQNVLRPLSGQSQFAVAGSTLAVAALFRPARVRIQEFIDRRFYRRRYNAAQTLDAFSARLRDEMDLDALTVEIVEVISDVMQPKHVTLWLSETRTTPSD